MSAQSPDAAAIRKARIRFAAIAVVALLGTGFAMAWNPPTAKVHSFTEASDYNSARESGCTNSGEGCHGSETTYADFNAYHPKAKCTTCHDYQGVGCIPCHSPGKEHECVLCHDGSKENMPDRVRLVDPYPRGHYRETTHTAMGTVMDREVRAAEGGKASATCEDCHSRDLKKSHSGVPMVDGSPYGADVGCGECHNDVRSRGMAEVVSDWKKRSCESCHAIGTSAPIHSATVAASVEASGGASCGASGKGCHEGNNLHALHPDAPKTCSGSAEDGEPGCHDLEVESHEPTATACGGGGGEKACHQAYTTGELTHDNDAKVHSPETSTPSSDTSAFGIACGKCHFMAPDGTSLVDEHALPTSEKANVPGDVCRDCHNDPAAGEAIADDWKDRDTSGACAACHGLAGLDEPHAADLSAVHDASSGSEGCADSGAGCHPSSDLFEVGSPTTNANIHRACLRCHDRTASSGNLAYDPASKSCGEGRDCHDGYDPADPAHQVANGRDSVHEAGGGQGDAIFEDPLTGARTSCDRCHDMTLGTEHARPNSSLPKAGEACAACHNATPSTSETVKASWPRKATSSACTSCHSGGAVPGPHVAIEAAHGGIERALDGSIAAGTCVRSGCHATADLRSLHRNFGCTVLGCHSASGDIRGRGIATCGGLDGSTGCHVGYSGTTGHLDLEAIHSAKERTTSNTVAPGTCATSGCHTTTDVRKVHSAAGCTIHGCHDGETGPAKMSCGGTDRTVSCHRNFSAAQHNADHSADMTGTVGGVTYGPGANEGCFGCHETDLVAEHTRERNAGSMDGDTSSACRICHANADDSGSGTYADSTKVKAAIAAGDKRCIACHASGSSSDGASAVASPHKATSEAESLPAGKVWADPFGEWKAAFDGDTGGGHNVLEGGLVGASASKRFPMTSFQIDRNTYRWESIPNTSTTTWLRASVFGSDAVATADSISRITIRCQDCHIMPEDAKGPHGASVRVWIDPEYSQTEYANPTTLAFQFMATGTDRVICFKCHPMQASVDPAVNPGGHSVHTRHVSHTSYPTDDPRYYGSKCIDCHTRIPHAWKRPRLLVRTVETTDGVAPDTFPYVPEGHEGLVGVQLKSFNVPADLGSGTCATGGCYANHTPTRHPEPADIPDAKYWP